MTRKQILTPANVELTKAIVKAHAPGKNRPRLTYPYHIATKPNVFHAVSEKEYRRKKAKVTLPKIRLPNE